jgi:amino acid adenylation domain-containing protein
VHEVFYEVADATPERTCVVLPSAEGRSELLLSYRELAELAHRVAATLRERGVREGDRVALFLDRSPLMLAVMLGTLEVGAAYVPLDPGYPRARLSFMLTDSEVRLVVASREYVRAAREAAPAVGAIALDARGSVSEAHGVAADVPPTGAAASPGLAVAYVMFTSGSTGKPKGVCIPHRGITRLVRGTEFTPLGPDCVTLQLAPVSFDASTLEVWGALLNAGKCVLYPGGSVPDPELLENIIREQGVTTLWLTASLFNTLITEAPQCLRGVRELLTGGEALSLPHVRLALAELPGTQLINGYGPTESTTFATCYRIPRELDRDLPSVPLGPPIANTTAHVLDGDLRPVTVGEPGELFIGGEGLATGYLNRPDLTRERFVPDPFSDRAGARLYRTGDRVRWLDSGVLEFLGRVDDQIKLHGHRIELGEVEAAIQGHPGVLQAVACVREFAGERRLLAYYTRAPEVSVRSEALRRELTRTLPAPMVPFALVELERIPLTPNGKADRRALPLPESSQAAPAAAAVARVQSSAPAPEAVTARAPRAAPGDPFADRAAYLSALWCELLNRADVPLDTPFFELGGTSLLAIKCVARVRAELGVSFPVVRLFEHPTLRALAAFLETSSTPRSGARRAASASSRTPEHAPPQLEEPIAVIGMVGRFPGANNVREFWQMLIEGRDAVTEFKLEELDASLDPELVNHPDYVKARGVLRDFDLFDAEYFGIGPREAEVMDPQHRLFLEAAVEALEDAGCDPRRFSGAIGVFAGSGNPTYFNDHLRPQPRFIDRAGAFTARLGNEKDFLVTRVAYKLGLTGPAVAVNTACSTSLVAVAHAVDALRAGHCDVALAGGVSVFTPVNSGYLYQEGGMLSPDGRCRPFDVNAQGTSFNDGLGMVVLKRLSEALASGDRVMAVIRGVGLNNDGSDKMSFTAPSVSGQLGAIRRAQNSAGIDPETISYVEAHGTATPIGDPIEVQALTEAFREKTQKTGFCALGSCKSNIGHVISAAGVTGLIKVALSLEHALLPKTVHFTAPNPELHIADSPFFVQAETAPWTHGSRPRRAAVSSFGVGGTNAHVIVEEAPRLSGSAPAHAAEVLTWSAKSVAALDAARARLADHLATHPEVSLADVAFTLHEGRTEHPFRASIAAQTVSEAVAALGAPRTGEARKVTGPARVAFLFPGQGAQYVGMGLTLRAQEPVFRAAFERCREAVNPILGADLLELLAKDEATLEDTRVLQPALFSVEYALSEYYRSLGIEPSLSVGHSVGEFAAACCAGVMDVETAARLVALRGKLLGEQPRGGMCAVRSSAAELEPELPPALEIAAENGPQATVVAGSLEDLTAFEARLRDRGVKFQRLRTSHAFHSRLIEPAVAPFQAEVARASLRPPSRTYVSTATGEWITAEQAVDPEYWGLHLRQRVRFSQAIARVLEDPTLVLLEVGPRRTLGGLTKLQPAARGRSILSSLSDAPGEEPLELGAALGQLWSAGVAVDWSAYHGAERRLRVALPTYPFQRRRFFIDAAPREPKPLETSAPTRVADSPRLLRDSTARPPIAVPPMNASRRPRLIREINSLLEELSGNSLADVSPETSFFDLGFDSLTLTQAAQSASKRFGAKLKLRHFAEECPTPAALAQYLDGVLAPEAFKDAEAPAAAAAPPSSNGASSPAAVPLAGLAVSAATTELHATALPSSLGVPGTATRSATEELIRQQLALMARQLDLLSQPRGESGSLSAPPPAVAPATPTSATSQPSEPTSAAPVRGHGPQLVIDRSHGKELSPSQEKHLEKLILRYTARTRKSKEFIQRNRATIADPRVVAGFRPKLKELVYPIVVERSSGSRLWDVDGNEYVDLLNGYGSNFFGYGAPFVREAMAAQAERGMEIGPQSVLVEEVTNLFREFVPMDRLAFCNTGSEAVLASLRLARTATGRDKVVMFTGGYHGIFDEVVVRGLPNGKSMPAAPGIPRSAVENLIVLEWGAPESLEYLRQHGGDIGAVITEPVQSRRPDLVPTEFLRELRAITEKAGTALIFDEVVTGFRVGPGGAQEHFGIRADLATYGKVIGGGISIGIVAGRREYMDALDGGHWQYGDASIPEVGVTYFAGTFVRHPIALAAARAVLLHLKREGRALHERVNQTTATLAKELNAFFAEEEAPIAVKHFSSVMKFTTTSEIPYGEILFHHLRERGLHVWDGRPCFMTAAHGPEELAHILSAFKGAVADLQDGTFYPRPVRQVRADAPPVPGAKLGRDAKGNPAWFVPDPSNPNKYRQLPR